MPAHDPARRRRGVRRGNERGCWVYLTAANLRAAGIEPYPAPPPLYRTWTRPRSALIQLYAAGEPDRG